MRMASPWAVVLFQDDVEYPMCAVLDPPVAADCRNPLFVREPVPQEIADLVALLDRIVLVWVVRNDCPLDANPLA